METISTRWWIQLPNGSVDGPFSPEKVVSGWKAGKIPPGSAFSDMKRGPWRPIRQCVDALNPVRDPEQAEEPVGAKSIEAPSTSRADTASPPVPGAKWYVARAGERQGPFTEQELEGRCRTGSVERDDLVWTKGMASWTRAADVGVLAGLFDDQEPPPLPAVSKGVPTPDPTLTRAGSSDIPFAPSAMAEAASSATPPFASPRPPQRGAADDIWAIAALALPLLAVLGLQLWMQSLRVIDAIRTNPQQTLAIVLATTVVFSGVFVALDAAKIGIGGPDDLDTKGRPRSNGPAHWGFFVVFLFVIGYPAYLEARSRRGVRSYLLAGFFVMCLFSLASLYFYASLNEGLKSRGLSPR